MLTLKINAEKLGHTPLFAKALSETMKSALMGVQRELSDLGMAFSVKSFNAKHVAYAWKKSQSAKLQQSGGNPGTTMPSEYYGVESSSYHPMNEIARYEAHIEPTHEHTRGEMPYKELVHGFAGGASLTTELIPHASVKAYWKQISGVKLSKEGAIALSNWANTYAFSLLKQAKTLNVTTPSGLRKLSA
jgi:hypothetical protein